MAHRRVGDELFAEADFARKARERREAEVERAADKVNGAFQGFLRDPEVKQEGVRPPRGVGMRHVMTIETSQGPKQVERMVAIGADAQGERRYIIGQPVKTPDADGSISEALFSLRITYENGTPDDHILLLPDQLLVNGVDYFDDEDHHTAGNHGLVATRVARVLANLRSAPDIAWATPDDLNITDYTAAYDTAVFGDEMRVTSQYFDQEAGACAALIDDGAAIHNAV